MKKNIFILFLLTINQLSFSQDKKYYPCTLTSNDGTYTVQISDATSVDFKSIWDEFEYSGNGYTWEGLVKQFIKMDKLNIVVDFDSEAGTFWANLKTRSDQLRLAKYIHDLCADKKKFREYVKKADRSLVDD